ncbi:MAG: hypothetical protein OEM02_09200, partial [Desulfobulbaceae bacterium]|nr:hypothetical protein [Desulfobulbaceae bacterium]
KKIIIISTIFVAALAVFHFKSLDGLRGLFLSMMFKEDTVFTSGYSGSGFSGIIKGMSKNEVLSRIGKPFYTNECWESKTIEQRWWYSKSLGDTHYRMREVRFLKNKVSEKIHYYYID